MTATLDFETEKIENRPLYPPRPVGLAIEYPDHKSEYLSFGHPSDNRHRMEQAGRVVRQAFEGRWGRLLFHNSKFDIDVAQSWFRTGWPAKGFDDSMYLAFLNQPHSYSYELKPLSVKLLGMPAQEKDELVEWMLSDAAPHEIRKIVKRAPSRAGEFIANAPAAVVGPYAIGDVVRARKLHHKLFTRIRDQGMLDAYQLELDITPITLNMERGGVRVHEQGLRKLRKALDAILIKTDAAICRKLGATFNVGSNPQLAKALADAGKLSAIVKTPTGKQSTAAHVLEATCADKSVLKLLTLRGIADKYNGTFVKPWIVSAELTGGYVMPSFHQTRSMDGGARTGRFCVHASTQIETSTGMFYSIDSIPIGSYVLTHRGRWRPVKARICKGVEQMYRLRLANGGYVVCTAQHRVLTSKGWEHAKNINIGDQVCCQLLSEQPKCTDISNGREKIRFQHKGYSENAGIVACSSFAGGVERSSENSIFTQQVRQTKSDARKNQSVASQLERRLCRWARLLDQTISWAAMLCAPYSYSTGVQDQTHSKRLVSTPYRWKSEQQQAAQSMRTVEWGTRTYASSTVLSIEAVGASEVWDIEVEEDHSYVAQKIVHHNSSSEPNLQNVPTNEDESRTGAEAIRMLSAALIEYGIHGFDGLRHYVLPDEGCLWASIDYRQQELVILAHHLGGALAKAYRENEKLDVHAFFKDEIRAATGIDYPRKHIKTLVFGILYGMGIAKLARATGMSDEEATTLRNGLYKAIPGLREFMQLCAREGDSAAGMRTLGGRVYHTEDPIVDEQGDPVREFGYKMLNVRIQGGAADFTKRGMLEAARAKLGRIAVQVHDELDVQVWCASHATRIAEAMCSAYKLNVPMRADIKLSGRSWGAVK